jgi:hypothetical protein
MIVSKVMRDANIRAAEDKRMQADASLRLWVGRYCVGYEEKVGRNAVRAEQKYGVEREGW